VANAHCGRNPNGPAPIWAEYLTSKNKTEGTHMLITTKLGKLSACAAVAALAWCSSSGAALFQPYVIRGTPTIQVNNTYVPGATEFIISVGGQKAGLGSSAFEGTTIGSLANVAISRLDDRTRFAAGSGPATAPYLNIWITDGIHFAVIANEPSDPNFQPLYAGGYNLSFADLTNKVAKVYENSDLSWLPTSGSSGLPAQAGRQNPASANLYTFADLAGYMIAAPSQAQLAVGWAGLGTGAPRELSTLRACGVNWIFGDTLANYVSGAEGYVVTFPPVPNPPAVASSVIVTPSSPVFDGNHVTGVCVDAPPGFGSGSFRSDGVAKTDIRFTPEALFGRAVKVGEVARLSYWTKKGTSHVSDPGDWYLTVYTKPFAGDFGPWYGSRIGTEPYFSMNLIETSGAWNQWTTDGAERQLRFFESTAGAPGATFGSYTDPIWSSFIAGNSLGTTVPRKDQEILLFTVQTASGWAAGFVGQVDGFTIELTDGSSAKINFEPTDSDAPLITCPANVSVPWSSSYLPATTGSATVTDCDPNPSVTYSDFIAEFCPTIITRTWTASDHASPPNTATCVQTITVNNLFAEDGIIWHQPLARNGASEDTDPGAGGTLKYRFKLGSTVPIQVHAQGCSGDVTANANVSGKVVVFGDTDMDGVVDAGEPIAFDGAGAGGGIMDKIDGRLRYNLDTKKLLVQTSKCYILQVTVTDSSTGESRSEIVPLQAK
jgi:hypothetical protein